MTLTWNVPAPEFPVETISERRAYQSDAEMGAVLRRQVVERERRTFRLTYPHGDVGTRYLVMKLFEDSDGGIVDMDYTTLDSEAIRVEFLSAPRITWNSAVGRALEVDLREVL